MNDRARAVLAVSLIVLSGCGEGGEADDARTDLPAVSDLRDGATEEASSDLDNGCGGDSDSSIPAGTPFRVRRCEYVAFERVVPSPPPVYQVVVQRLGSRRCADASVILATSFNPTHLVVATKQGTSLVVGYSVKPTPSGAGLSHVEIASLSPTTLATLRGAGIGSPAGSSNLVSLAFQDQGLVATGHKPEGNYVATFPDFLSSLLPPTMVIVP